MEGFDVVSPRSVWSALTRSAAYDAAGGGNRLLPGIPDDRFRKLHDPKILRRRARDGYNNNPWLRRAVDLLVASAIGCGIKPQYRSKSPEAKATVQRDWMRWADYADFSGRRDFYRIQQDALKAALIDGESLVRMVLDPSQKIPLQLQLLSCEFLDTTRVDDRTINGIEYDAAGRRVAYWLYSNIQPWRRTWSPSGFQRIR